MTGSSRRARRSCAGSRAICARAAARSSFERPACDAPWWSSVVEADGSLRPCFFHAPVGDVRSGLAALRAGRSYSRALATHPIGERDLRSLRVPEAARRRPGGVRVTPPVVLYNPRGESHILPLALVHVGSALPGHRVEIVDGRIDPDAARTVARLAKDALCLGVTVLTGAPILDARRVSEAARAARPDLPVIWGGWHPSLMPEQCLESGVVDACASGQGERTFADVVAALDGRPALARRARPDVAGRRARGAQPARGRSRT